MKKKFGNQKKDNFIDNFPTIFIENSDLIKRSKINFSYLDTSQKWSVKFSDLKENKLLELINKFEYYSKESLDYWSQQKLGHGGKHVFKIYNEFPPNSACTHPKHVPFDVRWCWFRVDRKFRLVGFVIPEEWHGVEDKETKLVYDKNTFYLVFLDPEHNFHP